MAQAREHRAACIVAVGGGAVIDLGKALSGLSVSDGDPGEFLERGDGPARRLEDPLPFVAMPTTAGTGAEATKNAVIGVPERQAKISLRDARLVPDLAIVDPALTDGAPRGLTLATGLDAITQLIESYLCNRANPVTDAICRATIPTAIVSLHRLMQNEDAQARDVMARASFLSGLALANSGLGIVHGLASVIGGRGAAHGVICGRLLASALTVNAAAVQRRSGETSRFRDIASWLATGLDRPIEDGFAALRDFVDAHDLPSFENLGLSQTEIESVATMARSASSTKANPVALDHDEICRVLSDAW
ncbi:alcohol dehydrogenase [Sinisalibacter lacisalsi]|uniref:Alcohol dehydrogenase n=1 Tax=Sinisalibacter lacisalsi TaxID=1526570 RepID=A0ABQ1QR97_9RHOB|nr:alcohol dehydrogenase [Sinisalibacter lacisalsi]